MPTQVFIRNSEGRVWGPLEPASIQLLLETNLLELPLEVSLNGLDFSDPSMVPEFADVVPREIWETDIPIKPPSWSPPVLTPDAPNLTQGTGFQTIAPSDTVTIESVAAQGGDFASKGSLTDLSTVQLYGRAAATDATGLFKFHLQDRVLEVHFRKGNPERVESNHPQDGLGVFLKQQGLVQDDKLNLAEKEKAKFGGTLIGALFGMGLLNPGTAFSHLAQRASGLLLQAFMATTGRFTFELKELPAHDAIPLGNRWGVLSDVVRRMPPQEFARRLTNVRTLPVVRANSQIQITDLKLSAVETRALSRIDGTRSMEQLVIDFPSEGDNLYRVVFLLRELGLVSFALTRGGEPPKPSTPAPPPPSVAPVASASPAQPAPSAATPPTAAPKPVAAAAKPTAAAAKPAPKAAAAKAPPPKTAVAPPKAAPAAPVAALTPEAELKELKARLEKLPNENFFQILGLPETADSAAVKTAYFALAKQYHPDTVKADSQSELRKLKGEMFTSISEAYSILSEDASRATYLSDLKSGNLDKVDVRAILGAEEKFQRACIVFKARRYAEALELIEECIAANPEEGEFYAWRGYARFILATDKRKGSAEAQRDLTESLKRNPRCGPAHYFSGMIAKASGDMKAAQRHFQNTVDLEPHHVDAQRELRLLSKTR